MLTDLVRAQQPFCKVWNVRWASAEAAGLKGIDQTVSAFCAVWAHFPVFPARFDVGKELIEGCWSRGSVRGVRGVRGGAVQQQAATSPLTGGRGPSHTV